MGEMLVDSEHVWAVCSFQSYNTSLHQHGMLDCMAMESKTQKVRKEGTQKMLLSISYFKSYGIDEELYKISHPSLLTAVLQY